MIKIIKMMGDFVFMPSIPYEIGGISNTFNLIAQVEAAKIDPEVSEVVFLVNSRGGIADGIPELMDSIYSLSLRKPTLAYVAGTAQSAGLYVASQCSQVVASPSASLGSLGAVFSCLKGNNPVQYVTNTGAEYKALPTPWEGEALDYVRGRADALADIVNTRVIRARPRVSMEVFTGKTFLAGNALDLGLIDGISPIQENLQFFS